MFVRNSSKILWIGIASKPLTFPGTWIPWSFNERRGAQNLPQLGCPNRSTRPAVASLP